MATIVTSGCNSLTREEVIEQIQEVLKAYENRIREIRHDTDRLVPEGKDIVKAGAELHTMQRCNRLIIRMKLVRIIIIQVLK